MPDQWKVHVSIVDERGKVIGEWRSLGQAGQTDGIAERFGQNFAEGMNQFRFFGTLRALISWLPATIILTAISYVSKSRASPDLPMNLALTALLTATLATIFIMQRILQREQFVSRIVAELSQRPRAVEGDTKFDADVPYHELAYRVRSHVRREDKVRLAGRDIPFRFDPASRALLAFFVILIAAFAVTVIDMDVLKAAWAFLAGVGAPGPEC